MRTEDMQEARRREERHSQEEMTPMGIGAYGKSKGKGKEKRDKIKDKDMDKGKDSIGSRRTRPTRHKNTKDAHNLDSTKAANHDSQVEVGGFDVSYFNVNAVEGQELEWIKTRDDTG